MITLEYLLSALISFSGLIFGILLVFIAPEEQKPGKKYFILLENILLVLIIIFLLTYFYYYINLFNIILSIFFIVLLIFSLMDIMNNINKYLFNKTLKTKKSRFLDFKRRIKNSYSIYAILAIVLYLSYKNKNLFFIESALIFLYGINIGSLLADHKNKKQNIVKVLKHAHFLIIALLLLYF